MRVTEVTTTIRYSAEGKGAWRSIEVGATATLTASDETLETAQQELYARLSRQLKTLWANGSGTASQDAPEGHQMPVEPSGAPPPPAGREHWCAEHGVEYKRYEKNGSTWYSHRQGNDWHNEG